MNSIMETTNGNLHSGDVWKTENCVLMIRFPSENEADATLWIQKDIEAQVFLRNLELDQLRHLLDFSIVSQMWIRLYMLKNWSINISTFVPIYKCKNESEIKQITFRK